MVTSFTFTLSGKTAERHLSQLNRTVEPLLHLGLHFATVFIDIDQTRQCHQCDNQDHNNDADYD